MIRSIRGPLTVVAALAIAALPAARSGTGTGAAARAAGQDPAGFTEIEALDDLFGPDVVRVPVGGTVEWENAGRNPHTVTADDGSFDSGNLEPGDRYKRSFDAEGAFAFFCEYHGAEGGVGMAGYVLVGEAGLPAAEGGVGPGREPVPTSIAPTISVPGNAPTIQEAVDMAEPGGMVLISPGVYHEAVRVTTPFLTIRGLDRNEVILDGEFTRPNGIQVIEADGVSIENMTARHYLLNGFYWTGVHGYRGSYLTAHNNGDYGLYAFGSEHGRFELSVAQGHPDSGFYIGQCDPCHAVITDVLSQWNGLGYSGTNASGDLLVVNSEWRFNMAGIVPNTLDSELLPPQHDIVIAGNYVHHNNNRAAPAKPGTYPAFGKGIVLAGTENDLVLHNYVSDHELYGIVVTPNIDRNLWVTEGNEVRENLVERSGRADLALGAISGGGDCFEGNEYSTSAPVAVHVLHGCGLRLAAFGGGDLGATVSNLALFLEAESGGFPRGDWRSAGTTIFPQDKEFASMPHAADAPPDPAIPEVSVPGTVEVLDARVDLPDIGSFGPGLLEPAYARQVNPEVTVFGIPLAAAWWQLLLGFYGSVLLLALLVAWITVALWDLTRREDLSTGARVGWMAVALLVPIVGPLIYLGFGGSLIPAAIRWTLAGALLAYVALAALGALVGAS